MAKVRTYVVSFSPAEKHEHGFTIAMSLVTAGERHEVKAATLPELETEVRKLAAAYGQTCSPYIRLKDRNERKPPHFDAWKSKLHIIEVEAKSEAA